MIGKIKGKLTEIDGHLGLIETTGGVYYNVFLTPEIISTSIVGHNLEVYTYLQVREDALTLYGFESRQQYDFFKLLLSVSGVGPKTAYGVISGLKTDEIITAVKTNQVDLLRKVPGLGRKTALKIILELSTKLKSEFDMSKMVLSDEDKTVIDALVSLGFKSHEARNILTKIPRDLTVEEKIKFALKSDKK